MTNGASLTFMPRGLSEELAAFYIGLSPEGFGELVAAGTMPLPRAIGAREVWDRCELDAAFDLLPRSDRAAVEQSISAELPPVFTPKTLAAFWGCSEAHVRELIRNGELRAFWLGKKLVRVRADEALAYQARQAVVDEG